MCLQEKQTEDDRRRIVQRKDALAFMQLLVSMCGSSWSERVAEKYYDAKQVKPEKENDRYGQCASLQHNMHLCARF